MASGSHLRPPGSGNLLTLSLFKFSYATALNLEGKLIWTHLPQRDNLFAVFDDIVQQDSRGIFVSKKVLKILRGGNVVECIGLDDLVYQAGLDEEKLRSQRLADADRCVIVIVKKPLIAVRYQLPDGQIRRMQMNFLPVSGFDAALGIISGLGLPIRDRNVQQDALQSSQGPILQPPAALQPNINSVLPSFLVSGRRSASQVEHTFFERNDMLTARAVGTDALDPSRSVIPMGGSKSDSTHASFIVKDLREPSPLGSHCSKCRSSADPSQTAFQSHPPQRSLSLSKSIMGLSQEPYRPNFGAGLYKGGLLPSPLLVSRIHTSDGRLENQALPSGSEVEPSTSAHAGSLEPVRRKLFAGTEHETKRPVTVPITANTSLETLTQILPPKRDLPFMKPATPKLTSRAAEEATRPKEAEVKPLPVKKRATAKPRKTLTKLSIPSRSSARLTTTAMSDPSGHGSPGLLPTGSASLPLKTSGPVGKGTRGASAARKLPKNYVSIGTQTSAPSSRNLSPARGKGRRRSPGNTACSDQNRSTDVAAEWMLAVEAFVRKHKDRPAPSPPRSPPAAARPVSDLEEYARRPAPERHLAVEAMICELIAEDNFRTLCEDVEGVWQRIGLGM